MYIHIYNLLIYACVCVYIYICTCVWYVVYVVGVWERLESEGEGSVDVSLVKFHVNTGHRTPLYIYTVHVCMYTIYLHVYIHCRSLISSELKGLND